MDAQYLKAAAVRFFVKKRMCVHSEVGLNRRGRLRADCLCLSMRGDLHLLEIKSSARDFFSDVKWADYLDYCHRMSFVMSKVTYAKVQDQIPKGIGVLLVTENFSKSGALLTGKVHSVQASRRFDLDEDVASNLIIRMAFRSADHNRYSHVNKG